MRTKSNIKCAADVCTLDDDLETCCVPATCGNWDCPAYFVPKFGVADQECGVHNGQPHCRAPERNFDQNSQDMDGTASYLSNIDESTTGDRDLCCEPNEMCSELECPEGWLHHTEGIHVSKRPCKGAHCDLAFDQLTCCQPNAECARDYECPVNQKSVDKNGVVRFIDFVAKPSPDANGNVLYCAGNECEDSHDRDTCCGHRAECASLSCMGESGDTWTNSNYAIKTEVACKGIECDFETDRDTCCFRRMHCGTMVSNSDGGMCREGWSDKDEPEKILCDGGTGTCDPRVDTETCCDPQETCDEMAPELFDCGGLNKHLIPDDPATPWADGCDSKCVKERCAAEPTCVWTVGPKGFGMDWYGGRDEDDQEIGSGMCGYRECHHEWGDACVCPSGIDEWDEPEQMEGGFFKPGTGQEAIDYWGWQGSVEDFESVCRWNLEEICVLKAAFTEMEVNGASKRKSVFGDDSHADEQTSVGAQGGPAMSDSADAIFSSSSGGGAPVIEGVNDAATLAANGGMSKGAVESTGGEFDNTNSALGERRMAQADVDPDAPKPDWADEGPLQATSIMVSEKDCTPKHNVPVFSGTQASEKCPEAYVSVENPSEFYCKFGFCTVELDQDTCCQARATCDTLTPPDGWALKVDAVAMLCRLEVCSADDRILNDGTFAQSDIHICGEKRQMCTAPAEEGGIVCPHGQTWKDPAGPAVVAAQEAFNAIMAERDVLAAAVEALQAPLDQSKMTPNEIEKAKVSRPAELESATSALTAFEESEVVAAQAAHSAAGVHANELADTLLCAMGTCNPDEDADACCADCAPGRYSDLSTNGECEACPMNTRSAEGFNGYGSDECTACVTGKYAEVGSDHCLACNPIFACAVKDNMTQETSKRARDASCDETETDDFGNLVNPDGCGEHGDFAAIADARAAGVEAWPAKMEGRCAGGTALGNVASKMACMDAAVSAGHIYFSELAKPDGTYDCESSNDCESRDDQDSEWRVHEQPAGSMGTTEDDQHVDMEKVLDEKLAELGAEMNARRLAFAGAMAGGGDPDGEAAGVSCSDGDSSICTMCVIGYRGSGTSKCSKCSEIGECKFPRGHKKGPSCAGDVSVETDLKCGECKNGFFGDLCEACDEMKGCADGSLTCSAKGNSVCSAAADGYYLKDDGQCAECGAVSGCIDTVCDSADASTCRMCEAGLFAAGPECAQLEFDIQTGTWAAMRSEGNLAQ